MPRQEKYRASAENVSFHVMTGAEAVLAIEAPARDVPKVVIKSEFDCVDVLLDVDATH